MNLINGWRLPEIVGIFSISALILMVVEVSGNSRLAASLNDFGHFPLFSLVSFLLAYLIVGGDAGRIKFSKALCVLLISVLFGAAMELIQGWVGRESSWYDLWLDFLGSLVGGLLFYFYIGRVRLGLMSALLLPLTVIALAQPIWNVMVLWDRDRLVPDLLPPPDNWSRVLVRASEQGSIRWLEEGTGVEFSLHGGRWPGVQLYEPYPDWRDFTVLTFAIYSPLSEPVDLTLRIDDAHHNQEYDDRYNRRFVIQPGENRYSVPVTDISSAVVRRQFDLSAVNKIYLYSRPQPAGSRIRLVYMRLAR